MVARWGVAPEVPGSNPAGRTILENIQFRYRYSSLVIPLVEICCQKNVTVFTSAKPSGYRIGHNCVKHITQRANHDLPYLCQIFQTPCQLGFVIFCQAFRTMCQAGFDICFEHLTLCAGHDLS